MKILILVLVATFSMTLGCLGKKKEEAPINQKLYDKLEIRDEASDEFNEEGHHTLSDSTSADSIEDEDFDAADDAADNNDVDLSDE